MWDIQTADEIAVTGTAGGAGWVDTDGIRVPGLGEAVLLGCKVPLSLNRFVRGSTGEGIEIDAT